MVLEEYGRLTEKQDVSARWQFFGIPIDNWLMLCHNLGCCVRQSLV